MTPLINAKKSFIDFQVKMTYNKDDENEKKSVNGSSQLITDVPYFPFSFISMSFSFYRLFLSLSPPTAL